MLRILVTLCFGDFSTVLTIGTFVQVSVCLIFFFDLLLFFAGSVPMRPLGCFVDNKSPYRPLPELIFTDNDPQSTVYSGVSVQADDWEAYMPELVCRLVSLSIPALQFCFSSVHLF